MASFWGRSSTTGSEGRRSSSPSVSLSLRGRRKSSCAEPARPPLEAALWPHVWAIRQRRLLDWSAGLDEAAERAEVKRMARLPVDVRDDLFLGDAACARDIARLRGLGVTHVLNAAGAAAGAPPEAYAAAGIEALVLEARDDDRYPMLATHLAAARAFLAGGRSPGRRVLVHCVQGLNRSAVLVAAELMLTERLPLLDAVRHCRARRGNDCLSNRFFQEQLARLADAEGLLGPGPGAPGCRVAERAPDQPPPDYESVRASQRASARRSARRPAKASFLRRTLDRLRGKGS